MAARSGSRQAREEIVALVVDNDERGEIDDFDTPDRLHAELGVFEQLDLLDAVLREARRRAADRSKIEPAILLAGFANFHAAIALGQADKTAARRHERVEIAVHASRRLRPERARGVSLGRFRRAAVIYWVFLDQLRP